MPDKDIFRLKVEERFKKLIPPLSEEEFKQLEENIIRDGCREPLSIWNNIILDGHNRYEICTRLQIPFSIVRISLRNREEAIAWICANQIGRRNISDVTRRYLIGKRYEMEKILGVHNARGINQYTKREPKPKIVTEHRFDETATVTAERLGREYRLSHAAISKYGVYANAIDSLSKTVPELTEKIITGQIKVSQDNAIKLSRLSPYKIRQMSEQILSEWATSGGYSDLRFIPEKRCHNKIAPPINPQGTVKEMPVYAPDAEITGLTLTVPSWVSSINRTRSLAKLSEVSDAARNKLAIELDGLKETINLMLTAMKEDL